VMSVKLKPGTLRQAAGSKRGEIAAGVGDGLTLSVWQRVSCNASAA
jgi:hypothetical protein